MAEQPRYYDIGIVPETVELTERIMLPWSTLNYLLNGLLLDRITLILAGTNAGKTTVTSQIIEYAIRMGYKTFYFAGEDGGAEARDRLFKQHTPFDKENYTYKVYKQFGKETNCGEYLLKHEKWERAQNFFHGKLFLYNNNIPTTQEELIATIDQARREQGCKLFCLDNVEMFDLDSENENASLKSICKALRQYAINHKIHIIIVSHIRKTERDVIRPSIFDAKGSNALTNISKNIISVIRTNTLDPTMKGYDNFKTLMELNGINLNEVDSVLEVLKTKGRSCGFCPLKFNKYTQMYYEPDEWAKKDDGERKEQILYTPVEVQGKLPFDEEDIDDLFD